MRVEFIRSGMRMLILTSQVRSIFTTNTKWYLDCVCEKTQNESCSVFPHLRVFSAVAKVASCKSAFLIKVQKVFCYVYEVMTFVLFSLDVSGHTEGSLAISTVQREKKLLNGIIQNLLPAVGPSVKSIILAYSSTVSSKMVRRVCLVRVALLP